MIRSLLFIGDLSGRWTRSYARLDAIMDYIPDAEITTSNWNNTNACFQFLLKLYLKLNLSIMAPFFLIWLCGLRKPDLLWIDNFPLFSKLTLLLFKKYSPHTKIFFISEDNFLLSHNHANLHKPCLQYYHQVFTTKRYVLEAMTKANNVTKIYDSYDHRLLTDKKTKFSTFDHDICFIGTYEQKRFDYLEFISMRDIKVSIFGNGWPVHKANSNLKFFKPVYGPQYREIVHKSKINLLFLRHLNFDEVTSRSFEVPSFGAFFLAETSTAHKNIYDHQSIMFSTKEDLLKKIIFWLGQGKDKRCEQAQKISKNILASHNSISFQVQMILEKAGDF